MILIDGFPIDNNNLGGLDNKLATINPNDISGSPGSGAVIRLHTDLQYSRFTYGGDWNIPGKWQIQILCYTSLGRAAMGLEFLFQLNGSQWVD